MCNILITTYLAGNTVLFGFNVAFLWPSNQIKIERSEYSFKLLRYALFSSVFSLWIYFIFRRSNLRRIHRLLSFVK